MQKGTFKDHTYVKQTVLALLERGESTNSACELAGIHRSHFHRLMVQGDFRVEYKHARELGKRLRASKKQLGFVTVTALSQPDIQSRILRRIRDGARPMIAAQAESIPDYLFAKWMKNGARDCDAGEDSDEANFFRACIQAANESIASAEENLHAADSLAWLTSNPETRDETGRGRPGWGKPDRRITIQKAPEVRIIAAWATAATKTLKQAHLYDVDDEGEEEDNTE